MKRRWLSVKEAAELAGVSPRVMRRRLRSLNERLEGKLLESFQPDGKTVRKWFVSPELLQACLRADHERQDAELEDLRGRMGQVEQRTLALRGAHRSLRKEVKSLAAWRDGAQQVILGLSRMLGVGSDVTAGAIVDHRRPRRAGS